MHVLIEEIPLGDRRLREFVAVPWRIHRGDPRWTPPLRADLLGSRLLGIKGLLTPSHPYHRDAEVTHFVARDGKRLVGRISAAVNHRFNEHYDARIGFFGFFESIDDFSVAEGLLDHARRFLEDRGMTSMRGPGGYSAATHEPHQGVLIDGFEYPPTMELTHNPPYYGDLLERYGLRKVKDYHAYWFDITDDPNTWLVGLADNVRSRRSITTRWIDLSRPREEVDLIVKIYNEAWSKNWGFLPLTDAEAEAMADSLKIVADPGMIRFAYVRDRLAAVLGALPDPNVPFRPRWNRIADTDLVRVARLLATRRRIPRLRLMFFGIRPRFRGTGIDAILYQEMLAYALERGYRGCEPSLLLEDNDLVLRASESMGGHRYKTWRIYEMPLGEAAGSQTSPSGNTIRSPSR
jgi:GNAT superfamily N-acetyltransferase